MNTEAGAGEDSERLDADTRLGKVLERWPALEEVLLGLSPHLSALHDPLQRKVLTRVATLRQIAAVARIPTASLVGRLRQAAGLPPAPVQDEPTPPHHRPAWATDEAVTSYHDVHAEVAAGKHPLPMVIEQLEALAPADVFELLTPLVPAPLIDLAARKGFEAYTEVPADGPVRTFFRRAPPSGDGEG